MMIASGSLPAARYLSSEGVRDLTDTLFWIMHPTTQLGALCKREDLRFVE